VDTAHGELEASTGGPGLGLGASLSSLLSTSRHNEAQQPLVQRSMQARPVVFIVITGRENETLPLATV
jgi:hypothetical protein